ncbi:dCTP deaminase domain-containing protein [Trichocoleus sp. FACHB-262]|uniref:dCTP deaminase domain-containing protein n=1 Tax=Trichocoleus sp. FACHB-262 TaxID=2692869 RepID=UPI00168976E1|nr:deoxycytidine triphosphate deaminase [Trichocoleus sp. FACHB-262]MBD2124494.1 deoxycytidine triphosphate deaminase [Trichocoleus sp. FACHB-262]
MSTLSNVDIEKEIGNNIYIYPFSKNKLRGASYNLTASKLAWSLQTKKSVYDAQTNKLIIPKRSTVLIETNEAIWVSFKIAGTYHSKVALVSKGLSHIGTTLDPEYVGSSLIAVHNHSDQDVPLTPEEDTFVTLVFQYVRTEASVKPGNDPGRPDVLRGYDLSPEEEAWLDQDFRKIPDRLKNKLKGSQDFQEVLEKRTAFRVRLRSGAVYIVLVSLFVLNLIAYGYLSSRKEKIANQIWYDPAMNALFGSMFALPTALLTKLLADIGKN